MRKITLLFAAGTLVLLSCGKEDIMTIQHSDEQVRLPQSCQEYEEMKASGEDVSREDHFATCKCPITCHFDDLQ